MTTVTLAACPKPRTGVQPRPALRRRFRWLSWTICALLAIAFGCLCRACWVAFLQAAGTRPARLSTPGWLALAGLAALGLAVSSSWLPLPIDPLSGNVVVEAVNRGHYCGEVQGIVDGQLRLVTWVKDYYADSSSRGSHAETVLIPWDEITRIVQTDNCVATV